MRFIEQRRERKRARQWWMNATTEERDDLLRHLEPGEQLKVEIAAVLGVRSALAEWVAVLLRRKADA